LAASLEDVVENNNNNNNNEDEDADSDNNDVFRQLSVDIQSVSKAFLTSKERLVHAMLQLVEQSETGTNPLLSLAQRLSSRNFALRSPRNAAQ